VTLTATTFPGHEPRARIFQATCAKRRCFRRPTQAYDVFSWFAPQEKQTPRHYEVCDKHAIYFTRSFDKEASRAVARDLVEHGDARYQIETPSSVAFHRADD
jgi:hypothetical protein